MFSATSLSWVWPSVHNFTFNSFDFFSHFLLPLPTAVLISSGELPLSLAACTNQFEVVEYLLNNPHQKARLQEQDTQGNTVLHALVMIADDTEENTKFVSTVYVEILKAGVKTDPTVKLEEIVNYDGLNPLQLAAKTGKVEVKTNRGNSWGCWETMTAAAYILSITAGSDVVSCLI